MKRASAVFTVLFVLLAWSAICLRHAAGSAKSSVAATKLEAAAFPTRGPSLTIVFRGLMVFHPDPARQYFEVGILPAPEHEFRMQVLEKSLDGASSSFVPLGQFVNSKTDVWSLEFPSQSKGVSFYQSGSFDRKSGVGNSRDFRWLIDLEGADFYNRKLQPDTGQLGVLLRVYGGEFYTKTTTLPLMRKKGDGRFEYFGRVAMEIATDVFLENSDMVLKSEKSGTEIFRLKEKPDTTYEIVIENAFVGDEHMAASVNHFQYYYQMFAMPRADWYEFKALTSGTSATKDSTKSRYTHASFVSAVQSDEAPCSGVGYGLGGGPP